jgi:hypothetical protein
LDESRARRRARRPAESCCDSALWLAPRRGARPMRFALTRSERALWSRTAGACWRAAERLRAVNRARARAGTAPKRDARARLLAAELRLDQYDRDHGYRRPGRECLRCGFVDCSCMTYLRHTPELPERLPMAERQLDLFGPRPPSSPAPEVCSDCDRGARFNDKCSIHVFDRPPSASRRRASRRAPRLPVGP